ncbi:hypothetical protein T06_14579 [Trichinella sp. T6]|nr:hypothetical protein T06_14579 [Trichinella sp. T6]
MIIKKKIIISSNMAILKEDKLLASNKSFHLRRCISEKFLKRVNFDIKQEITLLTMHHFSCSST